jgi:Flp pilus assembly pilin Flp
MGRAQGRASTRIAVVRYRIRKRETGQGMSEYAVVTAGVALVVILSVYMLGDKVAAVIRDVTKTVG